MKPQVQKNHGEIHEHIIKTKSTIYVKGTFHGPIKKKHFKWIPKPAMFFDDMFEFFFDNVTTIKTKGLRHEQSTGEKKLETTLGNIQKTKSNLEDDT